MQTFFFIFMTSKQKTMCLSKEVYLVTSPRLPADRVMYYPTLMEIPVVLQWLKQKLA